MANFSEIYDYLNSLAATKKIESIKQKPNVLPETEKIIKHHPRVGGRSELSGIKNLVFNSLRMIKYMLDLKNEIKKIHSN